MVRKHGWQLPAHTLQVVAITVFFLLVVAFYAFFAPFLGGQIWEYVLIAVYSPVDLTGEKRKAQESKNEELTDVKEAFDCLSLDLRTSRKDIEDLMLDLEISVDEAGRFEELHQESSLLAASETKKVLEL